MTIRCFRVGAGDVGIVDVPMPGDDLELAKETSARRLRSFFDDKERAPHLKPHRAVLIGEDGRTVAEFMVQLDGSVKEVRR